MTLDEAIRRCEKVAKENERIAFDLTTAFNMETIKSKECKKCANEHRQLTEWLKDYKRLKEREPCEDAISRQYLIDKAVSWDKHYADSERYVSLSDIQNAPPVNPQPKTGYWEKTTDGYSYWYRCSCCGERIPKDFWGNDYFSPYCPECNTQMAESEEE